jgi:MFS family permease
MQDHPAERLQALTRKNFLVNVAEGALYITSAGLSSVQTVLPALVSRLGGGNLAVGAVALIAYMGVFLPQVIAARYAGLRPRKKPWTIGFGLTHRIGALVLAAGIWLLGSRDPGSALIFFFLMFALNQTILGITTPGWFELVAKLTPVHRRGRLFGFRNALGGAGAFISGLGLVWLLANLPFPHNYASALLLSFGFQFAALIVQTRLVEAEPSPVLPGKPLSRYLRELPAVLKHNVEYRWFIIAIACMIPASAPFGFFTVYALERFQPGEGLVGAFTLSMVLAQIASALVAGLVADRYGNRIALIPAAAALLLATATALLARDAWWFVPVYLFVGTTIGSEIIIRYNMAIEYGPPTERATYVALTNTILAPMYLASIIGGIIVERAGYQALFIGGLAFGCLGLGLLLFRVRDPRSLSQARANAD